MERQVADIKNNTMIPAAIVIAGIIIAGALIYSNRSDSLTDTAQQEIAQAPSQTGDFRPISDEDHIRGNPNASVKIVEYSDFECPFCKGFHTTMQQIVDEYGKNGQVAWIYRHFPLDQIHPKARKEAEASECANELGGNTAFWAFIDRLFEITPLNNGLDLAQLPQIAEDIGLNRSQFESCLDSGKYAEHIASDLQDAINSGGQATPWSIVIAPNGKTFPLSGSQPFQLVKQLVDLALKEQ